MRKASERSHVDDELLMARYAAGDAAAFEELYSRYEAPLYGFCARLLGDAELAADAFQDAFLTVIEQRASYRAGHFRSWLFTIARNECYDRTRRVSRRSQLLALHAADASLDCTPPDIDARDELERLLAALPPDQREILLLHRYYGFSYLEIGRMWGTSEGAVKQKAYRALVALRKGRDG